MFDILTFLEMCYSHCEGVRVLADTCVCDMNVFVFRHL